MPLKVFFLFWIPFCCCFYFTFNLMCAEHFKIRIELMMVLWNVLIIWQTIYLIFVWVWLWTFPTKRKSWKENSTCNWEREREWFRQKFTSSSDKWALHYIHKTRRTSKTSKQNKALRLMHFSSSPFVVWFQTILIYYSYSRSSLFSEGSSLILETKKKWPSLNSRFSLLRLAKILFANSCTDGVSVASRVRSYPKVKNSKSQFWFMILEQNAVNETMCFNTKPSIYGSTIWIERLNAHQKFWITSTLFRSIQ